jgi:hypothetical protein
LPIFLWIKIKRRVKERRSLSKNNPPLGEKLKEIGLTGCRRGAKPLSKDSLPLSFKGEGDTGSEVDKEFL